MNTDLDQLNDEQTEWSDRLSEVAVMVESKYSMQSVNEAIELYRGPITIEFGEGITVPLAVVTWEWRREPVILCRFAPTDAQRMTGDATEVLLKPHKLRLDDLGASTWSMSYEGYSCGSTHREALRLMRPVVVGNLGTMCSAKIHLVNCHDLSDEPVRTKEGAYSSSGRLTLKADDWIIHIDQCPNHSEIVRSLNKHGGQAITHVVRICHNDLRRFTIDECNKVCTYIDDFISFATGSRPQWCLASGYDESELLIWESWEVCAPVRWEPLANWSSHGVSGHVGRAFPKYMSKVSKSEWEEPISLAIKWYTQAKHRGLETALVLGQAALELLANTAYEETLAKPCSESAWDKMPAKDRIRSLLFSFGVDYRLPPKSKSLQAFRFSDGSAFQDGPQALTELRNAIAHPKKVKRERFGSQVDELRSEAATLVLFYLEHVLLSIIGFDSYADASNTHGCVINYGVNE